MIRGLIEFLFPKRCLICERDGAILCALCERKITLRISQPSNDTLAFFDFTNPVVKKIIHALKYEGNRALGNYLGTALYREFFKKAATGSTSSLHQEMLENHLILAPLPLSKKSHRNRGYNQSQLICESIIRTARADGITIEYLPNLLRKHRNTPRQVEIRLRSERLKNLHGAFSVSNGRSIHGRTIILLDDVTTTGATFAEARRVLAPFQAKRIIAIAVAH